tara:strand:- start:2527 stop:2655 length:129 start_codon:yes stop_codon:yes gene_type:complete
MKGLKRIIKAKLIELNIKPTLVVVLPTGIICEHFANGTIKVI